MTDSIFLSLFVNSTIDDFQSLEIPQSIMYTESVELVFLAIDKMDTLNRSTNFSSNTKQILIVSLIIL